MSTAPQEMDPLMAQIPEGMLEEGLILAILHRVNDQFTDRGLMKALARANDEYGGMFAWCAFHPQYDYSPNVVQVLATLVFGGSVMKVGGDHMWTESTPHTRGRFGEVHYQQFSDYQRDQLDKVARWVVEMSKE